MQPCKACTVPESKFNTLKKHPNKVRMPAYEVWEMQNGTAGETQAANLQDMGKGCWDRATEAAAVEMLGIIGCSPQ